MNHNTIRVEKPEVQYDVASSNFSHSVASNPKRRELAERAKEASNWIVSQCLEANEVDPEVEVLVGGCTKIMQTQKEMKKAVKITQDRAEVNNVSKVNDVFTFMQQQEKDDNENFLSEAAIKNLSE